MIIYEPKGRAREYADLAANLYRGCGHGCTYCYAPAILRMDREEFYHHPVPRPNALAQLEKDARKLEGDPRAVLLCFSCDAYQPINDKHPLARRAIEILNAHGLAVSILTKRPYRAMRDFDLLAGNARNSFGVTLTCADEYYSLKWEPNADNPNTRLHALYRAHERGIATWVSFEPVLYPSAVLGLIRATHKYVDSYKIGKWNYDLRAKAIDWPAFRGEVTALLDRLGKQYMIKRDLAEAI